MRWAKFAAGHKETLSRPMNKGDPRFFFLVKQGWGDLYSQGGPMNGKKWRQVVPSFLTLYDKPKKLANVESSVTSPEYSRQGGKCPSPETRLS